MREPFQSRLTQPTVRWRKIRLDFAWIPIFCCAVSGSAFAAKATPEALEQVRQHIQSLRDELNSVRNTRRDVRSDLAAIDRKIAETAKKKRQISLDITTNRKHTQQLVEQHNQMASRLAQQRALLARQMRASYSAGRQDYLKMLLNQEQPMRVGRILTYYNYLNVARSDQITEVTTQIAQIQKTERSINAESVALTELGERLAKESNALVAMQSQRRSLLSSLDKDLNDKTQQLANLRADETRLSELLKRLRNEFSDIPSEIDDHGSFARARGTLPWPTTGPLAVQFGAPRDVGNLHWQGVVLRADEGAEVHAVWRGRIAFADWLHGYGMVIIIDHGDGYLSLYAYNESLAKEVGDWTEAGEVVATVGSSGGQKSTGLYFEIRHNGKPDNPARWCNRPPASASR